MKVRLLLAAVALAAAACGGGGSTRPTSSAQLVILSPTPAQVTGPAITLRFQVIGGTVLPPTQIKGPLRGDQGHIHVVLDGKLIVMAYKTEQPVSGLAPGLHRLQAEWVATDHVPFRNRVFAPTVAFTVQG